MTDTIERGDVVTLNHDHDTKYTVGDLQLSYPLGKSGFYDDAQKSVMSATLLYIAATGEVVSCTAPCFALRLAS